jgi:quinol monooxygenase YgiN
MEVFMPGRIWLLAALVVAVHTAPAFAQDVAADSAFCAVSYVEVRAPSAPIAVAALQEYREANRHRDGFVRFEIFEQVGRPGHFGLVETWRSREAFDARGTAAQEQLLKTLAPIRVSNYDQRPYRTLSVGSTPPPATGRAVSVITHVDVSPDPRVAPMLVRLAAAARAETGNLRFDVMQHTMRANHFTIVETWQSQEALDVHVAAANTRQYRDELQPLTGSPLDERLYKAVVK